jgi:hypothetical protein
VSDTDSDREYPRLAGLLVEWAPSFGASDEFLQVAEWGDLDLPSVVCGAFRRFAERVYLQARDDSSAEESFTAMERMATSPDPEVQNALIVDVFEHLGLQDASLDEFLGRLGPAARSLYDTWTRPDP